MTTNQAVATQLTVTNADVAPLVPDQAKEGIAPLERNWEHVMWLPCRMRVELRFPDLTVGDLLALEKGSVLRTDWQMGSDMPVKINEQVIGWMEFEVVDDRLAVRFTEIG